MASSFCFKVAAFPSWAMAPTCTLKPFAEATAPFAGAGFSALTIGPGVAVALLACGGAALPAGDGVAGGAALLGAVGAGDAFVGAAFDGADGGGGAAFVSAFASVCFGTAAGAAGAGAFV